MFTKGQIIKGIFAAGDIEFKVIKIYKNGLFKVKVVKGDKWFPLNKVYKSDGTCLFEEMSS